jgi:hypothetical protein
MPSASASFRNFAIAPPTRRPDLRAPNSEQMPADDLLRDAQLLCDLGLGSAIEEICLDDLALAWRKAALDDRAQLCDGFIEHSLLLGVPWWLGLDRRKAREHIRIDRDLPIGVVTSWHAVSPITPLPTPTD